MSRHHIHATEGPRGKRWHATVELGIDPATGKRRQKRLTAPTRKALDQRIADVVTKLAQGEAVTETTITVDAFLDQWLAAIAPAVKPSTHRAYTDKARAWLRPHLGHKKLARLTALDVQRLLTAMGEAGRAPKTVADIHGVLKTALAQAVAWRLVPRNVAADVRPPRAASPEMRAWSPAEAKRALEALDGDPLEGFWRLAITTGMRRGELLGLRWQDVDLDRGTIAVRHTLVRARGTTWEPSTPKTTGSRRVIAIDAADVAALARRRTAQKAERLRAADWQAGDYVFTGPHGAPVHPTSLDRSFAALTKRAGLPRIRVHDLRHTCASLLLAAGVHPKIVSERLGHSSVAITLDRYSHVALTMQQEAVRRLASLLEEAS